MTKPKEPEMAWHEMTSYCDECANRPKLVITEMLANRKGELWFKLRCPECGTECETGQTLVHIVKHCFDLDFLAALKIKAAS